MHQPRTVFASLAKCSPLRCRYGNPSGYLNSPCTMWHIKKIVLEKLITYIDERTTPFDILLLTSWSNRVTECFYQWIDVFCAVPVATTVIFVNSNRAEGNNLCRLREEKSTRCSTYLSLLGNQLIFRRELKNYDSGANNKWWLHWGEDCKAALNVKKGKRG